jgi:hypothetical protein
MNVIGQSAGKSYAYLLGVYLGDGSLSYAGNVERATFRLSAVDLDFVEATADAVGVVTGKRPAINVYPEKRGRDVNAITRRDQALASRLLEETEAKQRLPLGMIQKWPRDWQMAVVAGLMDSEGFVAANSNKTNRRYYMGFKCTAPWVPDFIVLLQSLGIRIGKIQTEAPRKEGYLAPTRFTIKMQSWIDAGGYFNIARKQRRVEEWNEAGAYERRSRHPRRLTSEANMPDPALALVKIESDLHREV